MQPADGHGKSGRHVDEDVKRVVSKREMRRVNTCLRVGNFNIENTKEYHQIKSAFLF